MPQQDPGHPTRAQDVAPLIQKRVGIVLGRIVWRVAGWLWPDRKPLPGVAES